jgi:tetratricopeptide (TPR) repeat protein
MSLRQIVVCVMVGCVGVAIAAPAAFAGSAEQAAKSFEQGNALLAKADFDGAIKAYAAAAKADPEKQEYRQQYAIVRRVMQMRDALTKEKNPAKWEQMAKALRGFYAGSSIYSEALAIDKQLHAKLNTPETAVMLAETQLAMSMNADAEKVLSGIDESKATPETRVMLGIALARQKKIDEAKAAAAKCTPKADAGPGFLYDLACLKALTGDSAGAVETITKAFENTPPSRLARMKSHAKEDKDLASVAGTDGFAKALKAESKVKESSCSGGSDCSKCPSKGGCSGSGGASCTKDEKGACPDKK